MQEIDNKAREAFDLGEEVQSSITGKKLMQQLQKSQNEQNEIEEIKEETKEEVTKSNMTESKESKEPKNENTKAKQVKPIQKPKNAIYHFNVQEFLKPLYQTEAEDKGLTDVEKEKALRHESRANELIRQYMRYNPGVVALIRLELAQAALQLPRTSQILDDKNKIITKIIEYEKASEKYRNFAKYIKELSNKMHINSNLTNLNYSIATRCIDCMVLNSQNESEAIEYYTDYAKAIITHYDTTRKLSTNLEIMAQWKQALGLHLVSTSQRELKDLQYLINLELAKYQNNDMLDNNRSLDILILYAAWYASVQLMIFKSQHAKGAPIEAILANPMAYDNRFMLRVDPLK